MFQIPSNNLNDKDKDSTRHLLRVFEPFTGKISLSEYRRTATFQGSRNKFVELYDKYSILIEYIESNLLTIFLQVDD